MNPRGVTGYTVYNALGQVLQQWGASNPVQFQYDLVYGDQVEMDTYQAGQTSGGTDWSGPTWPSGETPSSATTWTHDPGTGLVKVKTDPAGHTTNFTYNPLGQVASRTDARGLVTNYSYNTNTTSELQSVTYNDSGTTPKLSYTYDRNGHLYTVSDATGTRTFTYTGLQLFSLSLPASFYPGTAVTLSPQYDTTLPGRAGGFSLSGTGIGGVSQTWAYNSQGLINSVTSVDGMTGSQQTNVFTYNYCPSTDLVAGYSNGGNFSTGRYFYENGENRNLLTHIQAQWLGNTICKYAYTYNQLGQRSSVTESGTAFQDYGGSSNSMSRGFTYDIYGQLTNDTGYLGNGVGGAMLSSRNFTYNYDLAGNRLQSSSFGMSNPPQVFDLYDSYTPINSQNQPANRTNDVIAVSGTVPNQNALAMVSYSDSNGNAQNIQAGQQGSFWGSAFVPNNLSGPVVATANVFTALPSANLVNLGGTVTTTVPRAVQNLSYDANGNLTGDTMWNYTYDSENRLIEMTSQLPTNSNFICDDLKFTYDYLGRRVEKSVTNLVTKTVISDRKYVYSDFLLIAEFDVLSGSPTNGEIVRSYTWGLDAAGTVSATGGVGNLIQITNNSSTTTSRYLPAYDGNGNVATLTNASTGALAAAYEYSPFGEFLRAESFDSTIADNPFRFSTKFEDLETGLYYYGQRYYSPLQGKFITRDPIEEAGGVNLYGFVGNDPVNGFDYLGMNNSSTPSDAKAQPLPDDPQYWGNGDHGGYWDYRDQWGPIYGDPIFGSDDNGSTGGGSVKASADDTKGNAVTTPTDPTIVDAGPDSGGSTGGRIVDAILKALSYIGIGEHPDIPAIGYGANNIDSVTVGTDGVDTDVLSPYVVDGGEAPARTSATTDSFSRAAGNGDFPDPNSQPNVAHGEFSGMVIQVTRRDGSTYIPMGIVKANMASTIGAPQGIATPYFYPSNKLDPQTLVNVWHEQAAMVRSGDGSDFLANAGLVAAWAPGGPGDWKVMAPLGVYDNTANFMYAATATAYGYTQDSLLGVGDADHHGTNYPENNLSIRSGSDAIQNGGTLSLIPYTLTW